MCQWPPPVTTSSIPLNKDFTNSSLPQGNVKKESAIVDYYAQDSNEQSNAKSQGPGVNPKTDDAPRGLHV
jgi:hypothetical protein